MMRLMMVQPCFFCRRSFQRSFFFSTCLELKTKGAGGGGAGHEMMDSNTSLPPILTPKHFSSFCYLP